MYYIRFRGEINGNSTFKKCRHLAHMVKKTTLDFEKVNQNLFLITGDTGAGKRRSLMRSFCFIWRSQLFLNKKEGDVVLQSQYVDLAVSRR